MTPRIRPASISDLKRLNEISVESKKHWEYPEEWIEHWRNDLTLLPHHLQEQTVMVVERTTQIVGFCSITENESSYEILHLWIVPSYIGKGYGKILLQQTIDAVVKNDKVVIVEADPNAEPFYQNQGFKTFDKVESYPKGRFLPVMKRSF